MAEPVPAAELAAHDAKTVIALQARMRIAPVFARHLPAAGGGKHAAFRVRRQLREEAGHVGRRADEARGRGHRVGRVVAGNDEAPAHAEAGGVWPRANGVPLASGMSGCGFAQAGGVDDLALDPDAIGLLGDRLRSQGRSVQSRGWNI